MFDVRSFKISKNDHIIDVQQFDDIDFVCPYYSTMTSESHRHRHRHHEYYVIYRVSIVTFHHLEILVSTKQETLINIKR